MPIDRAIAKINAEMQREPQNLYMEAVGHHVIDSCTTEANAEAILTEGRTLRGALDAIRAEAKKQATGGVAVMTDAAVFAIADNYFGLTNTSPAAPAVPAPAAKPRAAAPAPAPGGIALDLDSFF